MDEDIDLVVNCLKHHDISDVVAMRESLLTIASLCTGNDAAQNKFREGGGLGYTLNLLTSVDSNNLRGAVLYALGCATDSNVFTQRRLCSDALFKFLQCQITSPKASAKLKSSAAYFLSCLITNNSTGQNLIRSSGCLNGLLSTLSTLLEDAGAPRELWLGIIKTLCSCVNNPRNDENQLLCGSIFPLVLRKLEESGDPAAMQLISYFISLTVQDSEANQERLGIIGGLEVITSALQDMVESFIRRPNQQIMISLSRLVTTLGIASSDHERNCDKLTELQAIPLLVQILSLDVVTAEVKLKVILTLSSVTQSSEMAQKQLVNSEGLVLLVQTLLENQSDEEICKAITSVMESCIGWVSALGTENLLYSNTLGLLSGSAPPPQKKKPCPPPPTSGGPNFLLERLRQSLSKSSNGPRALSFPEDSGIVGNSTGLDRMLGDDINVHRSVKRSSAIIGPKEDVFGRSFQGVVRSELPAGPVSVKRRKLEELLESPEGDDTSSLPQGENEDINNNENKSVSYGYGYIQQKLGKLEDKFDKVLKYLSSFRSREQDNGGKGGLHDAGEPANARAELGGQLDGQCTVEAADKTCTIQGTKSIMGNQEDGFNEKCIGAVGGGDGGKAMTADPQGRLSSRDGCLGSVDPSQRGEGDQRANQKKAGCDLLVDMSGADNRRQAEADQRKDSAESHRCDTSVVSARGDGLDNPIHESGIDKDPYPTEGQKEQDSHSRMDREKKNGDKPEQDIYCKSCSGKYTGGKNKAGDSLNDTCQDREEISQNEKTSGVVPQMLQNDGGGDMMESQLAVVTADGDVDANLNDVDDDDGDGDSDRASHPTSQSLRVEHRAGGVKTTGVSGQRTNGNIGTSTGQGNLTEDSPHGPKCPGCNTSALLNSQTFIKTLMSSMHTCSSHKALVSKVRTRYKRRIERLVHKSQRPVSASGDVYSFTDHERERAHTDNDNTPLVPRRLLDRNRDRKRRPRQDFNQEEICNLIKGVNQHGKHWNTILWSYQFKEGRTSVDLKDKYRRLVRNGSLV